MTAISSILRLQENAYVEGIFHGNLVHWPMSVLFLYDSSTKWLSESKIGERSGYNLQNSEVAKCSDYAQHVRTVEHIIFIL